MAMNTTSTPRGPSRSAQRRTAALLASAFAIGALFAAAPAHAHVGPDSVRITDGRDSVRITAGCEGPDREHILCVP
jgi:hypothetical protein